MLNFPPAAITLLPKDETGIGSSCTHHLVWNPWDKTDPRVVTVVRTQPSNIQPNILRAKAFQLSLLSKDGTLEKIGAPQELAIFQQQDTIDLLPWFRCPKTKEIQFIVYDVVRPAIGKSMVTNLPGGYLSEKLGGAEVSQAIDYTITQKLGLIPKEKPSSLGNYLPSPSIHSEAVIAMSIEVEPLSKQALDVVSFRDDASRPMLRRRALTAQQIFSLYDKGEIQDGRLIDCILRFCRKNGIDIDGSDKLADWFFQSPIDFKGIDNQQTTLPVYSYDQARQLVCESKQQVAIAEPLDIDCGFLSMETQIATNINSSGNELSEWEFEKIVTPYDRSVDVIPWFIQDNKIFVVCQHIPVLGAVARKLFPHVIQAEQPAKIICGLSGFLDGLEPDRETLEKSVLAVLRNKAGIVIDDKPTMYIGHPEYTSPGYSNEASNKAFIQINPAVIDGNKGVIALEITDLIRLIDEGDVPDHRLSGGVRLLEASLEHIGILNNREKHRDERVFDAYSQERLDEFDQVVNQGSALQYVISRISPDLHQLCMTSPTYRKLLSRAANELGLVPMTLEGKESVFFRDCIPLFTVYMNGVNHQSINEFAGNASHDASHQLIGGFLPYRLDPSTNRLEKDSNGKPITCSLEHFSKIATESEIKAVTISDDLIPREASVEEVAKLTWRGRQALYFKKLGLSHEQAAAEIRRIELYGEISPEILSSEAYTNTPEIQDAVRRVVKFGVLDKLQLNLFYQNWLENEVIAETVLRFGTATGDDQTYMNRIHSILKELEDSPEGVNALKAENAAFCTVELFIPALRLSFAIQEAKKQGKEHTQIFQEMYEAIDSLISLKNELETIRSNITTLNKNKENLDAREALYRAREIIEEHVRPILETCCLDTDFLSDESRKALNEMLLPGFVSQMDYDREEAEKMIEERIRFSKIHI